MHITVIDNPCKWDSEVTDISTEKGDTLGNCQDFMKRQYFSFH
jgi:hypothetical protein